MRKLLKIDDINKFIYYKNRKVRTPVILEVENKELKTLILSLNMAGIEKYSIGPIPIKVQKEKEVLFHIDDDKQVVVEELEEPTTILQKLMRNGDGET